MGGFFNNFQSGRKCSNILINTGFTIKSTKAIATKPTLGQKIKRYRLMNDIRQADMANQLAVSRATLINYEKGHTTINVDVLDRLKNAYPDFDIEFLFCDSHNSLIHY